jgi:acyl carrier protein
MSKAEIFQQMEGIFKEVFDNDEIVLKETTTANDVEGWDSITHIQLIVALENHFNIKVSLKEILLWKNVGEIADAICSKTS